MRTSLRLFAAALSSLLAAAFLTIVPFAPHAHALQGVSTISVDNVTVSEATSTVSFNVTVQPTPSVPFDEISADIKTVDDTARAGQDYNAFTRHVSWDAGDDATIHVTVNNAIINDGFREPNEKFTLSIVNAVSASPGQPGSVTITNDDGGPIPTFNIVWPAPANEGNDDHPVAVKVSLNNPTGQAASINYATSDGSATSNTEKGAKDYEPKAGTLTWAANDGAEQTINVTVHGDAIPEPNETFFVNFGSPNNGLIQEGQNPAHVDLLNDDGTEADIPKLTLENIPDKLEGDTSTTNQTITVTLAPAAAQIVTVDYTTSDGTAIASNGSTTGDYTLTKGTLSFPANSTSQTFSVPVVGDPATELDEIYHVTLSNPTNATIADPATKDAKILNDDFGQITTVPGQGGGPHTRLFGANGADLGQFFAYEAALTSGLHVARGDFFKADGSAGGDGVDEIVTAPGAFPANSSLRSKPVVRIFAVDGTQRASFFAYDPNFAGGAYVAAGNFDGDPSNGDELVVGAGKGGGPHVKVLRIKGPGDNIGVLSSFFAYTPAFSGGVRVATGNLAGDAKDEIITAPGAGGGPHVRVWTPTADGSASEAFGFMAYDPGFGGGVNVAAANGRIVTGPGPGGGPHIRTFDGSGAAQGGGFMAYDPTFTGGVSVALGNLDTDLAPEIVTGAGAGGGPHVKVFHQDGSMPFGGGFFAYDPNFHGGVEVAISVGGS